MASDPDSPHVIVLPPLLYVAALAAGLLLNWAVPQPILSGGARWWPLAALGVTLIAVGVTIAAWARSLMERAGTNVNPMLPTTAIVTTGPFRFSRNPLYIALNLMYVGLALLTNAAWVLALIVPLLLVMHYGVIRREERYLDAKFGDAYRGYRARVRRYI